MYVIIFFLLITQTYGGSIAFINNVFLQSSTYPYQTYTMNYNSSCTECLCQEFYSNNTNNDVALNCFSNGTCQFFQSFPLSYAIQSSSGSRLYFLQNQFPNASQCCMPNITELLIRLQNATPTVMNLTFQAGAIGYDPANSYEAAVAGYGSSYLYWFNPVTMTFLRNFSISGSYALTVYNNQTFTATNGNPSIFIRDSQTNNYLANITYPTLSSVRKIIFLNNGQTAVVSTQSNLSLTFFNVNSPTNYTMQQIVPVPMSQAHGIAKVNDTFLYVSSWAPRTLATCKYENSTWTSNLFTNYTIAGSGAFTTVDDCGRVWYVDTQFGLVIYNSSGIEIATWNMSTSGPDPIYDILILPNYVMLISHTTKQQVIRYDPQMTCP